MLSQNPAITKALLYACVLLTLVFFIGPIFWFVLLAIRPPDTAFSMPPQLFFEPTLAAFRHTLVNPGANAPQALNSFIVAGCTALLNLPFALPAAYALSRFPLRAKKHIMLWYLGLLMAPPVAFLIPYFVVATQIGLAGSYLIMVLVLQTLTIPFSVWLMKGFIDDVPIELEEAAKIDGARWYTIMLRVTLPIVRPGIIVTSMFAFVFAWNNTAFPLVLSSRSTATLPVGTLGYFATTGVTWNYIAAAAVIAMIPPMVIFLVFDRYVVRGLSFGSVKG